MKQNTAIEYLLQELDLETISKYDKQIVEAKSIEKMQIIEAYYDGDEDCINQNKTTGKQYFEKKYES